MSTLLAFDTATERLAAVVSAGGRSWVHEGNGGAQASAALIPALLTLLDRAGVALSSVDAVAYGRGPGAFTGLRTACSVAQGLAFGAGKPVLALDTLMAVAEHLRQQQPHLTDVWAAVDARMGEVYAARYRHADGRWKAVHAPALHALEDLAARWRHEPPAAVAGNAVSAFAGRLPFGEALLDAEAWPSARALLPLAEAAWRDGAALDPSQALPLYLRDKVALTTEERIAARGRRERAPA